MSKYGLVSALGGEVKMKVVCPDTGQEIPPQNLNVKTDIALSPFTGKTHRLSALVEQQEDMERDIGVLDAPPKGTWLRDDGNQFRVGAGARNWVVLPGWLFFCTFWNSILSVLLILPHLDPVFFGRAAGGVDVRFGFNLAVTIFMSLFLLFGTYPIVMVVYYLFGKVEIVIENGSASAFTGVGGIGFTHRFDPSQVRRIKIQSSGGKEGGRTWPEIRINADNDFSIGECLLESRLDYLAAVLRQRLPGNNWMHLK